MASLTDHPPFARLRDAKQKFKRGYGITLMHTIVRFRELNAIN